MKKYPISRATWGTEIEWGDIPRNVPVPAEHGSWNKIEVDVINLRDPYKYVCCDMEGKNPPVGGEINTVPTQTWQEQVDRYFELEKFFAGIGSPPTVCMTAHTHIHCYVPGLAEDIDAIKKLVKYTKNNQKATVEHVYKFRMTNEMKYFRDAKKGVNYLRFDGGRLLPDYLADNLINMAKTPEDFKRLYACGKDGIKRGIPYRYAINLYALTHIRTVEFRCFRGTLDRRELSDCFRFTHDYLDAALNDGPSVEELVEKNDYKFPEMIWDLGQYKGWLATRTHIDMDHLPKKVRTFIPVGDQCSAKSQENNS